MSQDFTDKKRNTLKHLRAVALVADDAGAKSLAKGLREDRIERLEEECFHLVVLGEFNHGKTTFVNSLLGEAVLPMGVTPTTAVIHRIRHGSEAKAKAFRQDGALQPVPLPKLEDYEVQGEALADDVQHIDLSFPAPFLEGGVVLVDTPGVNDLNEARAEITYGYIPRSDAVLFLLDAGQILKESERTFIEHKLLANSRDKLVFVINKIDLLDEEEQEEAIAYAKGHLEKLIDSPKIYAISAEKALEGGQGALAESGVASLLSDLKTFLEEERGGLLLRHALEEGLRAAETLTTSIEVKKRALSMETGELSRRLAVLESDLAGSEERLEERRAKIAESISSVKARVARDAEHFAADFAARIEGDIKESKAEDLKKYLTGYIESEFRGFADRAAKDVAGQLEKIGEEAIAFVTEDASAQSERLKDALGDDVPELNLDVNTFAYDVGVFAVGAFGVTLMMLSNVVVGGALTLAAPVLSVLFKGRAEEQIKERAAKEAPQVIKDAGAHLAQGFEARIDEFGDKLLSFVTAASEDLSKSIAELVRTVRDAKEEGGSAEISLRTETAPQLARLAELKAQMRTLKEAVDSGAEVRAAKGSLESVEASKGANGGSERKSKTPRPSLRIVKGGDRSDGSSDSDESDGSDDGNKTLH